MSGADEEAALLGLAPVAPVRTVAYGPHPDQVVDLYPPAAGAARGPLVVLLHGGFWRAAYDRRHLSPLAAELAGQGLPVALAEYRRVGGGGGGARTFDDVTAAVAASAAAVWDVEDGAGADGTGAGGAVPEGAAAGVRPVLVGHSAGGQLALLTAARLGPGAVGRVVAVAPVADLAAAHRLGLSDHAVAALLGDEPGLAERIAAADPVRHPPAGVPVTILHGTDDGEVPPELSRRFAAAAGRQAATLRELPGVGHYAPVTPGTPACRTLLGELLAGARTG
ncbi:alpha/beta hydrolase family protein [Streptomyces pinistramenti]|uniref:alpha/beta hydrolase family protein n=1 Tax=Streptomyces pinistramenti TaxID=2884812 RepID=UPI001D081740|nr:prolyl oligopeptidase family serine peptidase [Streptomyces pinistramenti]MCB5908575.1 prolyl oligopeptidase family serine peptidase [Streptomyces pinistramenti]